MQGVFIYLVAVVLAAALVHAAWGDLRTRIIPNWLNLAIAAGAPIWWWANGWSVWPDVVVQIGIAIVIFMIFAGCFAIGAMGGGDVKLITALSLWLDQRARPLDVAAANRAPALSDSATGTRMSLTPCASMMPG